MTEAMPICMIHQLEGISCVEILDAVVVDDAVVNRIEAAARQVLEDFPGQRLLIDFGKVTYVSSAMFGRLIALNRLMKARGWRLLVCGMSPLIREMFAVTHLDQLFDFFDDRQAALRLAT